MIQVHIQAETWAEVEQQLAGLIRTGQQTPGDEELKRRLNDVEKELFLAKRRCGIQEGQLAEKDERIAELETRLKNDGEDAPSPQKDAPAEAEKATDPEPTPEHEAEPEPEQPSIEKADLRAFLAKAREDGVNIAEILQPFGGRFPDVKPEDYPALKKATEAALAELEAKK